MTDRDTSSTVYGGRGIDWNNINEYLKDLVCRCATKTKSRGFRFFALRELGKSKTINYNKVNWIQSTQTTKY